MWPVKIGTNLSKEGDLAFEDARFHVHQREAFSTRCRLSKITSLPIPWSHFRAPPNPYTHLNSTCVKIQQHQWQFTKTSGRAPTLWTGSMLSSHCYFLCRIWSSHQHRLKEGQTIMCTIGDMPQRTCPDFTKIFSRALGKEGNSVYYKYLNYVFKFLCKVDYDKDKFIHVPIYSYKLQRLHADT